MGSSQNEFWSRALVRLHDLFARYFSLCEADARALGEGDMTPSDATARFVEVVEMRGFVEQVARLPELVPLTTIFWTMHCRGPGRVYVASRLLHWVIVVSSFVQGKDLFDALIARMGEGLLTTSFFSTLKRTVELRSYMDEEDRAVLETLVIIANSLTNHEYTGYRAIRYGLLRGGVLKLLVHVLLAFRSETVGMHWRRVVQDNYTRTRSVCIRYCLMTIGSVLKAQDCGRWLVAPLRRGLLQALYAVGADIGSKLLPDQVEGTFSETVGYLSHILDRRQKFEVVARQMLRVFASRPSRIGKCRLENLEKKIIAHRAFQILNSQRDSLPEALNCCWNVSLFLPL